MHAELPVSGLSPLHDGLRIGLVTDLHHSEFTSQADIARAVDLAMAQRPDVIVLGGDYVSFAERRYMEPCAEALAPLEAPGGVFAILGNHDDDRYMPAALESRGFTVLKDRRTTLTIRGAALVFAGIRFWTRAPADIARVVGTSGSTAVLLAHDPRVLNQAAELAVPVVLSGHTHGGPNRAAVHWGTCRPQVSRAGGFCRPRTHQHLREPGRRHGVPAGTAELPAGGGGSHAPPAARECAESPT